MRTDHVAFEVSNMDEAIRFYTQVLGLPLLSRNVDSEHGEEFAFIELSGGNIELLRRLDTGAADQPSMRPSLCPHLAVGVEDLNEAAERLARHGVPILKGPLEIQGLVRWLYFCDPDKNILEFVQWLNR